MFPKENKQYLPIKSVLIIFRPLYFSPYRNFDKSICLINPSCCPRVVQKHDFVKRRLFPLRRVRHLKSNIMGRRLLACEYTNTLIFKNFLSIRECLAIYQITLKYSGNCVEGCEIFVGALIQQIRTWLVQINK